MQPQRGAALLLAMMIVALITTTAAGMVWLQARAVQVEAAERARDQAAWILGAALDWARLILREDRKGNATDGPDDLWARNQLAEARLSDFLAVDQNNNAEGGPEAFLSGGIADAQARYNLRNLIDGAGKVQPLQLAALQRLADLAGAPGDTAARIAALLSRALAPAGGEGAERGEGGLIRPERLSDLVWLGIDAATLARLAPWVDLLPVATAVNINTAPREVLVAAIDGLDLGSAERLVQRRLNKTFENLADAQAMLPDSVKVEAGRTAVNTSWFQVTARLRLEGRVVEELSLVQRDNDRLTVRRRERRSFVAAVP